MKKIVVSPENLELIDISNLSGNEIIAYVGPMEQWSLCVLTQLIPFMSEDQPTKKVYGFIPVGLPSGHPRYPAESREQSIQIACKYNEVFALKDYAELIEFINKRIYKL